MRKWFLIIVCTVMVLSMFVLGCDPTSQKEELEVQVRAQLTGYYYGANGQITNGPIPNVKVRFEFFLHDPDASEFSRLVATSYEVTGADGMTPYAIRDEEIVYGDESINVQASVADTSLPSDSYGPAKTWIISSADQDFYSRSSADKIEYESGTLQLTRDTSPSLATSSITTSTTTSTTTTTQAAKQWDISGNWDVGFLVTNAQGQSYGHHYNLSQTGTNISGTGYTPITGTVSHYETISGTIGITAANAFTLNISYNDNSYAATLTGTIDSNGQISGTWYDNYKPQNTGTFSTIDGTATLK